MKVNDNFAGKFKGSFQNFLKFRKALKKFWGKFEKISRKFYQIEKYRENLGKNGTLFFYNL